MIPFTTVGSCNSIKTRTDFSRSSRSSRRLVPACTIGFSTVVVGRKETLGVEVALFKMSDRGVCRVVLVLLLGAFGLTATDVAFI
eukprot:scaffold32372_cov35-Attheya_sp.AAC.2